MARFETKFISYSLCRSVEITVIIPTATIPESLGMFGAPATHVKTEKYPVLYLLHGMGNSHTDWCSYANVELFAEEQNIAVVMLSGENSFYRTDQGGADFFRFVSEELPQFVTNLFPISDKPENSYIAGLSMGGYGALLHGFSHPERFAAIGEFSGAIEVGSEEERAKYKDGPYDIRNLAKQLKDAGTKMPPLYMACGENDMLYEMNVEFKNLFESYGWDITWKNVPGYTHEWRFWNLQVEEFLKWIPRADFYAQSRPRQV